ncbi:MAG: YegP family protein [Clostridia bacterium]|nr:YegP family protein [Clostridia bacterium]
MGLFSWFKRKKKKDSEAAPQQRHFCEERPKRERKKNSSAKSTAEEQIEIVDIIEESSAEEVEAAEKIASDKEAKSVRLKGFSGAFDVKRSRDGRYVFNLIAANKMTVATSRVYSSAQNALSGIGSVITNAPLAELEDQTLKAYERRSFPKWEIYIDREGKFRFRLRASNGTTILRSQGYTQKSTCKSGIESVIKHCKSARIDKSYLK